MSGKIGGHPLQRDAQLKTDLVVEHKGRRRGRSRS